MVETASTMLALGTPAPDFRLQNVISGRQITTKDVRKERGLLVMFISYHCPYVRHILAELARFGLDYMNKGIGIVAISSNDVLRYPKDTPNQLAEMAFEHSLSFPICFDGEQGVAKAYTASCTPDFFLFDSALQLVYRGQFDDSRPGNGIPVTGEHLRRAMNALLEEQPLNFEQKPSMGCNIKWKPGNEPWYFTA